MIYTLTLNPAIDYLVFVDDFESGKLNRSKKEYKFAGGKGINVSRVLKNMDLKSKAFGFIGGFSGDYLKSLLEKEDIESDFVKVDGDTRINIKLKSKEETEINANAPKIKENDIDLLLKKIDRLKKDDVLVLAGNIPSSMPNNIYEIILKRLEERGIKAIVDTTKESLLCTLKYKPFLIKPNIVELEELFDVSIETEEEIIKYSKELLKKGAKNVIVSMGKDGALFINDNNIYKANAPKGELINSVGAGDSMVAGFIYKYIKTKDLLESFKYSVASGSATAFSKDLAKINDIKGLFLNILVEER
ncbi:MAG: 1-phosphofructokinase [Peptostreptococcaceae bacterium]|jgi:1-phosphofructokinase|nr:1-phosphofructokinase [Peptostreptococcaceae bacterium]